MAGSLPTRQRTRSPPAPMSLLQARRSSRKAAKAARIMPAISLASADDLGLTESLPSSRYAHVRKPSTATLLPEAVRVALERGFDELAVLLRRRSLYRQTLIGPVADHIHAYADDYRTRTLQDADSLMRGRFRLAGHTVDVRQGSI